MVESDLDYGLPENDFYECAQMMYDAGFAEEECEDAADYYLQVLASLDSDQLTVSIEDSVKVEDSIDSLVSEDGMIHVAVPPHYNKTVPCKPIGKPFYDEDDGGQYLVQFCEYKGHIITALPCIEANEEGGYPEWDGLIVEGYYDDYISPSMQEEMDKLGIGFDPDAEEFFYWKNEISDSATNGQVHSCRFEYSITRRGTSNFSEEEAFDRITREIELVDGIELVGEPIYHLQYGQVYSYSFDFAVKENGLSVEEAYDRIMNEVELVDDIRVIRR